MSVTNIVMLVKDRPHLTMQALESLYRHTPKDTFNLTLIDDCSATPLGGFPLNEPNACGLINMKSKGITGQARNLGVSWADTYWGRGDFLYLSDNDVYFTDGWLAKLTKMLGIGGKEPQPVELLGGSTHPFHGVNGILQSPAMPGFEVRMHDAVSGYSHLMTWGTWDAFGPHDAHAVGIRQSEDWKFCQDIIGHGGRVGTIWPEVVYATGLTDTFGQPAIGADQMIRYPGVTQL